MGLGQSSSLKCIGRPSSNDEVQEIGPEYFYENEQHITQSEPDLFRKTTYPRKLTPIEGLRRSSKLTESIISTNEEAVLEKNREIRALKAIIKDLETERETLSNRLSAAVSAQLTNNNPNIADLSDRNRPTKLAEKFSELYDNEWTDAYAALEEACEKFYSDNEPDLDVNNTIVYGLVKILTITYKVCSDQATEDMQELERMCLRIYNESPSAEIQKQIKEKRKQAYKTGVARIEKEINEKLDTFLTKQWALHTLPGVIPLLKEYIDKCIELCWLMAIQDPPVYMECDVDTCLKKKVTFDKNLYKEYTKAGKRVAYIVWPVLYLHKSGPILNKGVAQGRTTKRRWGGNSSERVTLVKKTQVKKNSDKGKLENRPSSSGSVLPNKAVTFAHDGGNEHNTVHVINVTERDCSSSSSELDDTLSSSEQTKVSMGVSNSSTKPQLGHAVDPLERSANRSTNNGKKDTQTTMFSISETDLK